jgi:ribosomal protein S18 acetylase RimI-like enzyme
MQPTVFGRRSGEALVLTRSNVRVRRAIADDVQALAHLVRSINLRSGVFSGRPLQDSGIEHLAERFTEIIADGERELLVAVEPGVETGVNETGVIEPGVETGVNETGVIETGGNETGTSAAGTDVDGPPAASDEACAAAGGSVDGSDADRGGAIVGMLAARRDDIGAIDLTGVLHVTHLMVDPRHRRRGVGRALLTSAVESAERLGVEHVVATTASDSRESNRYLARLGFAPLVVQRIAQTSRLRRSLGMSEPAAGAAVLRRARVIRAQRAGFAAYTAARGH